MNTLCDIAPNRVQENELETEQNIPTERLGQIYKRILVGTDFSVASNSAFEQGLKLAKQNGAELLIAHACATPNTLCFMPPESYGEWELSFSDAEAEIRTSVLSFTRSHKEGVKAHRVLLQWTCG
jgi:nucleotide-binding universal stress UspA family protein